MIHEASEGVWGVSECLGGARAWIQLGTHSEVTQTRQERWLLWEQAPNYSTWCDVGNCGAYVLSQRQYQQNFCLNSATQDTHHSNCLGSFPSPRGGVCPGQSTQGTAAAPRGWVLAAARPPMPTWSQGCVLLLGAGTRQILPSLCVISLIPFHVTWKFHLSSYHRRTIHFCAQTWR